MLAICTCQREAVKFLREKVEVLDLTKKGKKNHMLRLLRSMVRMNLPFINCAQGKKKFAVTSQTATVNGHSAC